jgi:DNA-binding NarL/FixJ family response regulator
MNSGQSWLPSRVQPPVARLTDRFSPFRLGNACAGKEPSRDAIVPTPNSCYQADHAMMPAPLRVLMADDHPIVLAGMKALVAAEPDLDVVGEARDGRSALSLAKELRPDAAVLDIGMPGLNGLEVALALRTEAPGIRVIILTVHEDRAYLRQLLEAGVSAYLLKRSAAEELVRAIHAVADGGLYLDPAIAGKVVGTAARGTPSNSLGSPVELSERETEVLRLLAEGHTSKEISSRLSISVKTVETYKARAMDKLGFKTRVDVVRYAASRGWLRERAG